MAFIKKILENKQKMDGYTKLYLLSISNQSNQSNQS